MKDRENLSDEANHKINEAHDRSKSEITDSSVNENGKYSYNGKPFSMGVADRRDGHIEQAVDYKTAKAVDWHHNMWVKPHLEANVRNGTHSVFWMEGGKPVTMEEPFPPHIAKKLSTSVKKQEG